MQKIKHFTTSCGFCGVELVLPEWKKFHYLGKGKKKLRNNHFCDVDCFHKFKRLTGASPGFLEYIKKNPGKLIQSGIKLGALTKKIYTSEFLRNLQLSTKLTCAYPDCSVEISKIGRRSKWNCCPYHTALVTRAVWAQNKYRKNLVEKHGVEPIEQIFEYLPAATLACSNCKKKFVRSGKKAQVDSVNVYCSKKCQWAHHPKSVELECATCGKIFYRYQSQMYVYPKEGGKKRPEKRRLAINCYCSAKCRNQKTKLNLKQSKEIKTGGKMAATQEKKAELAPFSTKGSSGITDDNKLDNYGRLKLRLRTLQFNTELQRMDLVDDIKELIHQLLYFRKQSFEFKYQMVFILTKLRQKGSFWLDFNFNSLDDLLIHLDLPNGTTLGMWEVLVRLFDKDTFLLVGDEVLGYMTRVIALHQPDSNIRKSDYQGIFDAYCGQYPTFDKKKFCDTIDRYTTKKYLLAEQYGDNVRASRAGLKKGQGVLRGLSPVGDGAQDGPELIQDFSIRVLQCNGCQAREKALRAYNAHLAKLERQIQEQGGQIPQRPLILEKVK